MHFWGLLLHSYSPDNRIFFLTLFLPHSSRLCWKGWSRGERFSPTHVALSFFLAFCEDYPIPSGVLTAPDKLWCWQKQSDPRTAMPAALELETDRATASSLLYNNSSSIGLFWGLCMRWRLYSYWFNLRYLEIRGPVCPFSSLLLECGRSSSGDWTWISFPQFSL